MTVMERPEAEETVRVSRLIPASVEAVWCAWTTPEETKRWWGRSMGMECHLYEMDLKPGGVFRLGIRKPGAGDTHADVEGVMQRVEPPHTLVYTWSWTKDEPRVRDTLVTVSFHPEGDGQTRVSIVHERLPRGDVTEMHREGWTAMLEDVARAV
ncbi:MAG: SRPBCC domain-containing protein [Pseudomonadota bacterium]